MKEATRNKKEERRAKQGDKKRKKGEETRGRGGRFAHEMGRHGPVRSKKTDRFEPQGTLRRSKAVLEARGDIS